MRHLGKLLFLVCVLAGNAVSQSSWGSQWLDAADTATLRSHANQTVTVCGGQALPSGADNIIKFNSASGPSSTTPYADFTVVLVNVPRPGVLRVRVTGKLEMANGSPRIKVTGKDEIMQWLARNKAQPL